MSEQKVLIDCRDAALGYEGRPIWEHLTFQVRRGDYLCIVGDNGSGKSTLLKSMLGLLRPLSGEIRLDESLRRGAIGYLPQQTRAQKDFPATVSEVVLSGFLSARGWKFFYTPAQKSQALQHMGKLGILELKDKCYRELSGGQKRRLQLLLVLLEEPNVLILDEPGNDMDTDMLAVMEDLLDAWPGTLVMVSHDRYLMERVTDNQYALIDGHIRHMPGGVDEYLRFIEGRSSAVSSDPHAKGVGGTAASASALKLKAQNASGLSNAELHKARKELSSLERRIATQERKLAEARQAMTEVDVTDYVALEKQQQAIAAIQDEKDGLEMEWLELSEKIGE